MSGKDKLVQ